MNRDTDKNYEVCLQNKFSVRPSKSVKRTRVLENISEILTVSSPFTLFHYVLNKISTMVKHASVTGVLELSGAPSTNLDLVRVRQTLLRICWQNYSFDSRLSNGFLKHALRIKQNNIIALFFFSQDFIQLCDSRIRDIGFRVQFSRQVINFPIKL